jgi:hypothetical protein
MTKDEEIERLKSLLARVARDREFMRPFLCSVAGCKKRKGVKGCD